MSNNEDLPKILICYVEEVAYDAQTNDLLYGRGEIKVNTHFSSLLLEKLKTMYPMLPSIKWFQACNCCV